MLKRNPNPVSGLRDATSVAGQVGRLFEGKDWSRTPLGPVETWPQSLLAYVTLVFELPSPAIIFWGDDQIQIYNDGYATIMGPHRHPRYFGEPYRECWPDTYALIHPWMREVLDVGEVKEVTKAHIPVTRHGFVEEAYFTFTFSPLRDDEGDVAGILQPVAEVTEAVLAERRAATLHALEPRHGASDATGDAIAALEQNPEDVPFALIYLWDDATETLGLAARTANLEGRDAAIEQLSVEARGVFESNAPRVLEHLTERLGTLDLGPWPEPVDRALVLPVGKSGFEAATGAVVFGVSPRLHFDHAYRSFFELAGGQVARAVAEVRAVQEIQERAEALAELDRAKTTFFSNVSHELRTPLTLIIGPTEDALTNDAALSGGQLETVYRNEMRLLKLVNALLDFSRIEAGRAVARRVGTDLCALTRDIATTFGDAIERAGLEFDIDCVTFEKPVAVDRDMWEKIVLNLLSNALKFTFEGRIRIALRLVGDDIELVVSDTGVGIPKAELPRLFERFHRVEGTRARSSEGTGIGLALVHSLVDLHGGRVDVESAEGVGTTFTVRMPRLPASSASGVEQAVELHPEGSRHADTFASEARRWLPDADARGAEWGRHESDSEDPCARVLIVDDNADMRDYLASLLCRHWRVETAVDGAEALAAIEQTPVDVVLTDIMMPNIGGFELLRALRADPDHRDVRVVMISARAGEEARMEGIEAGADDYLVKPFSAREVVARVSAQLALRRHARERSELLEREKRARREAEIQKQHLFSLFMQAPAPIAILRGERFVIELANYHACDIWGRSHGDVIGRPLLEAVPEVRGQGFEELLNHVVTTGESYTGTEVIARLGPKRDDEPDARYLNFTYTPLRNVDDEVDGVMAVGFDVTEQVTARERISELRKQAESANRAKDEFLAMLGHELRNPLAPILTAVELMRLQDDESFYKERALIERQARQLVALVDDLLDVSRITRGKIELKKERVRVEDIAMSAVETVTPLLEQRRHQLEVRVDPELAVMGDPRRLTQIVSNLLSNAAKYTDNGGQVSLTAWRRGDHAMLAVRDNGRGIAPELLPRIFDMFAQEQQALDRSHGGLGLGLSIVKSLVELHGGSVKASSEGVGQGSEFRVRLPVARGPAPSRKAPDRAKIPVADAHKRILIVDDNEDAALTLSEYVAAIGYEAHTAHDGPAALQAAKDFDPDVVLLDIGLPGMDGYEVAHRLRDQAPRLCIVAVTGYGHPGERERTLAAGFDEHLVKPVDTDRLSALLRIVSPRNA